jgi:serine/threonine-protein kinase
MITNMTDGDRANGPTEAEDRLGVGSVVDGRYELVRLIGRGGMGRVFEVRHRLIKRRGALKCLHSYHVRDEAVVARFLAEARAAAAIGSEHIVDITDAGVTHDGTPYLVMEYLDGEDFSKLLKREGPLAPATAVELVMQACRGLIAAHRKGIIHRDLKPENLLVTRGADGVARVKILDFGMAKFLDNRLTSSQDTFGSPYYMAPEQFFGAGKVDHRADIYSLGVILYELLTGVVPFKGSSVGEIVYQVTMTRPSPVSELRPDVPAALERVVVKAMSAQMDTRFQSVDELAEALAGLASPATPGATPKTPDLVRVPAGRFEAGSPPDESGRSGDETRHDVVISRPYRLFARPVTQAEWQALMGNNPSHHTGADRPVEMVSWFDAVAFCNALSRSCGLDEAYVLTEVRGRPGEPGFSARVEWKGLGHEGFRLPTEAEWERACRGAGPDRGGACLDEIAWYADDTLGATQAVGQKEPSGFGMYDMLGNVWEWCWDWYGSYPQGTVVDPTGPASGLGRVDRGGAWNSSADLCRASNRDGCPPNERNPNLGFRPARTDIDGDG